MIDVDSVARRPAELAASRPGAELREVDEPSLAGFVDALFRYSDEGTFASIRSFYEDRSVPYRICSLRLSRETGPLVQLARRIAAECANAPEPVVFCPPVATFADGDSATEASLANGLALSVECDQAPRAARERLEVLLGPATVVVASGGEWVDPGTGEVQERLHLHWRLSEPTRDADAHRALKRARALATGLVGGDASNAPVVHPIRWPGSWHRKLQPRLSRTVSLTEHEIDLQGALERLRDVTDAQGATASPPSRAGLPEPVSAGEERETAELVQEMLRGRDYHAPLAALAMRFLKSGMPDAQAVLVLRGVMGGVPPECRDTKDGVTQPGRWQARFDDIPRAVSTARAKLGAAGRAPAGEEDWPAPLDFLADASMAGAPELRPEHLPDAVAPFVFDSAERMGVDPAGVALAALVSLASVASDEWAIQPKQYDTTWTENPRLWGAIVGDPSILKTPVLRAATRPIDAMEAEARKRHAEATQRHKAAVREWKDAGSPAAAEPKPPRLDRHMVEGATIEALSEVLRDDLEARQSAPARKVLVRQDELSEWVASFDRYRSGGRGGGDRGAYLRLYNGGRYTVDRVGRGAFAASNWSACVLGGIQPGPIQQIAREAADDGLLQRFCYCVPACQGRGQDRAPDEAARARYEALFRALAALRRARLRGGAPEPVVLHADAHRHRLSILDLAEAVAAMPDTSPRLKAAIGKWPGLFARLALTFHLIAVADSRAHDLPEVPVAHVLPEATARRVASYMRDVLLPHLLRAEAVMFATEQTGHARWVAGHILSTGAPRVAARDIMRAYGALSAPEDRRVLQGVMESLEAVGWVRAEPQQNPAKPPTNWAVNPAVHRLFAARAAAERELRHVARQRIAQAVTRARQGGKG